MPTMALPPIIYEDDSLLAFDKPGDCAVASERGGPPGPALLAQIRARYGAQVATVHRLDTETSGVLVCAKTKPALDFLSGQFQARTAVRVYHALAALLPAERAAEALMPVRGADGVLPDEFKIELALGEDEHQPGRMRVYKRRGGRPGLTDFRTQERFRGFVWLECRPVTGRTHQIRVHLAAGGVPILGDALYGDPTVELRLSDLKRGYKGRADEKPLLRRLALHASEVTVTHPVTRLPLTLRAPLPAEFEVALKYLRKFGAARSAELSRQR
ncbi:MAG: RNA pseudouridine synthase [Opitutae bacterium]|nr:RNA pseudouridine synthase [Opitutae bacterium]